MARDEIDVQYPVLNHEESVAHVSIYTKEINPKNGIAIRDAFSSKHNQLFIHIINKGDKVGLMTVKAGNAYPNSMLGDIIIEIAKGISVINLEDLHRFINEDKSLQLDFNEDFDGNIYAIARWAGVSQRNY